MRGSRLIVRCLLLCCAAVAAESGAQQSASVPRYHVEIVVFENLDISRNEEDFFHGIENPRHEPEPQRLPLPQLELETLVGFESRFGRAPQPPIGSAEDPIMPAPVAAEQPAAVAPGDALKLFEISPDSRPDLIRLAGPVPDGFRILRADELDLGDVRADIYRRREYRVLGHAGWAQTGVDENEATGVDLSLLGITNPMGTIKVYLRRFLHVAIELDFLDGRGTFWTAYPGSGLAALEYAKRYRHLFEHNAIRSGQLVYIDHPLFGIFIQITPAPEPAETAEPTATTAPGRPAA
jgi:hypothetical protein